MSEVFSKSGSVANPSSWQRTGKNLFLICVLLFGAVGVFAGLFARQRISTPPRTPSTELSNIKLVANQLDVIFDKKWHDANINPAQISNDFSIARRISLGLAGTIPSLEELRAFEKIAEENRLNWWLDRVLSDRRTHDNLAERFGRAFIGIEDGPFILYHRHRFVSWLSEQFAENRPYDAIVREMLTDDGLWTDTPGVNFYTVTANVDNDSQPDPIKLAAKTSRALLGMRIDCLQCHDDFLGSVQLGEANALKGGEQVDFHQLAAFFADTQISLAGVQDSRVTNAYEYRLLGNDAEQVIEPKVPYGAEFLPGLGPLRSRLAKWVTARDNLPFARVTVNRIWAIVFGRPLIAPVDDIPWGKELPTELDLLAKDFIDHDFDIQRTIRILVSSRVFRMESRLDLDITQTHEQTWAVFPHIRLRPEQMAGSLLQATSLTTLDSTNFVLSRIATFGQQNQFMQRFGDFGVEEFTSRGETVTQRLLMLNGDMLRKRIGENLLAPAKLAAVSPSTLRAVEVMYLACLSRYPSDDESQFFTEQIDKAAQSNRREAIEDFYWALLNSAEFSWNH